MSKKPSFEAINYLLRPNKNVERKLIAATLQKLQPAFDIDRYRYVGFGSIWFVDFILFHRMLGIDDMISIEARVGRERRVKFNRPFACIDVRMGAASACLGDALDRRRSIVWLDYDGPISSATSGDPEIAIGAMPAGSILLVTVNANLSQLKNRQSDEKKLTEIEYLCALFEDERLKSEARSLTNDAFPWLVVRLLHARFASIVLDAKPGCEYAPIWSFAYADNVEMITVGGMIVDEPSRRALGTCDLRSVRYANGEAFRIDLPTLTEREKRALDMLLPRDRPLQPSDFDFELRPAELEAYQQLYLQYPVFNENV